MKKTFRIPIQALFSFFNIDNNQYDIPQKINRELYIKTPTLLYSKVNYLIKKHGVKREYVLSNNIKICCDENHLVKSNGKFDFIKNVKLVDSIHGQLSILSSNNGAEGDVYDLSIDVPHEYITSSGIICHNTAAAKILYKNIPCDFLYINSSDENGIDVIRTKIKDFASSAGFHAIKIVVLDECLDETTLVTILRDGNILQMPIKELKDESDLVKSLNINTQKIEWRPFYLIDKGESDVYEIEFENGETIICTDSHKWYVNDENGNPVKMKVKDIISKNIQNILTFTTQ